MSVLQATFDIVVWIVLAMD